MTFGLTNAPAAFQRFINLVFMDMLDVCIVVYLDDILVYLDNMEDHTEHIREVLWRLRQHKLLTRTYDYILSYPILEVSRDHSYM